MNHSERTANHQSNESNQIKVKPQTKVLSATSLTCIDDKAVYLWPSKPQSTTVENPSLLYSQKCYASN